MAFIRLRGTTGTGGYSDDLVLDRVFARFRAGPALAEVGRDVVAIGPAARTQLAWSDNAPPIDQVRLETLHPYPLAEDVHGSLLYLIGQRRDPAQQHPPLITIARAQLDVGRVAVGLHQELALGGDGVPSYSLWDFALEHVRRRDSSAGPTDSSNRRFGGDVAVQLPGARVYYELVFEDLRKHVVDALHYDADHLIGADLSWLVVELQRVGVRSYEHVPAITQFTNAGRIVGSPLGPDTQSVYVAGRVRGEWGTLTPWVELVRFSSDTYTFIDHGPILHDSDGTAEYRYRIGAKGLTALTREIDVEARLTYERVTNLAFQSGTSRNNAGLMVTMTWRPGWLLR